MRAITLEELELKLRTVPGTSELIEKVRVALEKEGAEAAAEPKRWHVKATYADRVVEADIEEISELHQMMEFGPDWTGLVDVKITYNLK
jgi:hypothetical protein